MDASTAACATCGALIPSGNAVLHALRCTGAPSEKNKRPSDEPSPAAKKPKPNDGSVPRSSSGTTVDDPVEVLSDDDEEPCLATGGTSSSAAAHLQQHQTRQRLSADEEMAWRLQREENEAASEAVARRLQQEAEAEFLPPEFAAVAMVRGGEGSVPLSPLDVMVAQENERRKSCEGPPCPPEERMIATYRHEGKQQRLQGMGRAWDPARPCVSCDDAEVAKMLQDVHSPVPAAACDANRPLLRGLCAWRKHVVETYLETREIGAERWRRTGICTSEQCFLGRKGGVLCHVASSPTPIRAVPQLLSAFPTDAKQREGSGLPAGFAMLIALYFDWPLDAACAEAMRRLRSKLGKKEKEGAMSDRRHPWGMVFAAIDEQTLPIDARVKHLVLSRAHLP